MMYACLFSQFSDSLIRRSTSELQIASFASKAQITAEEWVMGCELTGPNETHSFRSLRKVLCINFFHVTEKTYEMWLQTYH